MKIYIAGPMFSEPDISYNRLLRDKFMACGFDVYCPNDNQDINDKTRNDITSGKIYNADLKELMECNVLLCRISLDCGTMWEAGYMRCLSDYDTHGTYWGCIGLVTDIRLQTVPDPNKRGVSNQAMYIDQFIVGGLQTSLGIYYDVDSLLQALQKIAVSKGENANEHGTTA